MEKTKKQKARKEQRMKKYWRRVCVCVICLGLLGLAGPEVETASAGKLTLPSWAQEAKAPVDWFDWGMDFRARMERFPNAIDRPPGRTDPIGEWYRLRTRGPSRKGSGGQPGCSAPQPRAPVGKA